MKKLFTFILLVLLAININAQERRVLSTQSFTELEVSGSFDVLIRQGPNYEIVAESEDFDEIDLDFDDDELSISWDGSWLSRSSGNTKLYITVRDINSIDIGGAVQMNGANTLNSSSLELSSSGASHLDIRVSVSGIVEASCSGASQITLTGNCGTLDADISGSSDLNASDMVCAVAKVNASGASDASINASQSANIESSGASDVTVRGEAEIISETSGASSVRRDVN